MKYNVQIIGAGNQAALNDCPGSENEHKIISFAHAFRGHPGFNLLGFHDINKEKAAKAAQIWKTDYWFGYAVEADVIAVATPDENHLESLIRATWHKPKLVICEKPLTTNLQHAEKMVKLYKNKNIPLAVDYTRNYIPCLRNLTKEHGRAISGYCLFNRGIFHTAIHAAAFFRMLNLTNYKIKEVPNLDFRVWVLNVAFEDGFIWSEERITDDMPVPDYYDNHMTHVVDNLYNFLEGKEELFCTGEDALRDMEVCFELMGEK